MEVFCPVCDGIGKHYIPREFESISSIDSNQYEVIDCWACRGTGKVNWDVDIDEENVRKMFKVTSSKTEKFDDIR